jgi:hypothetical protein
VPTRSSTLKAPEFYVIWGAYHGFLPVVTRVAAVLIPVPARLRRWLVPAQIAPRRQMREREFEDDSCSRRFVTCHDERRQYSGKCPTSDRRRGLARERGEYSGSALHAPETQVGRLAY